MIARHWRGWTKKRDAAAFEQLLTEKVLPDLKKVEGYRGGYVLRNDAAEEVEFVVVNLFDSLDAVRRFAGPNYSTPVLKPGVRPLLFRFETVANHYEIRVDTVGRD